MAVNFLNNASQGKKEPQPKKTGFFGAEQKKSAGVNLMTSEVLREATRASILRSQEQKKVAVVRQELDAVNREIAQMEKEHSNLTLFQNKLSALKTILDDHQTLLPFFDGLEKNTLPEVFYSTLVFSSDGTASLSATTTSYTNVGRQLLAFQESKGFITSVQFSGIASSLNQDGKIIGVNFTVLLRLDPALFKKEPSQ